MLQIMPMMNNPIQMIFFMIKNSLQEFTARTLANLQYHDIFTGFTND